jgi:mRNA-degrading endonuclease RelE of RelBE toxin-antitoxin system
MIRNANSRTVNGLRSFFCGKPKRGSTGLRENPLPEGKNLKKIMRIIYQIVPEKKEVWILDTDYRGRVYKN